MVDVERELRDLRRTLAQMIEAIDPTTIPSYTAIRVIQIPAQGAAATELAPARKDRIRLRLQAIGADEVDVGISPQVAVEGGWRLGAFTSTQFTDDPPAPSKGAWYAWCPGLTGSIVVVMETIRGTEPA